MDLASRFFPYMIALAVLLIILPMILRAASALSAAAGAL